MKSGEGQFRRCHRYPCDELGGRRKLSHAHASRQFVQFLMYGFIAVRLDFGKRHAIVRQRLQLELLILAGHRTLSCFVDSERGFLELSCRFFHMSRHSHGPSFHHRLHTH